MPNLEKVNASHPFPKKKSKCIALLLNNGKKGLRTKRKSLIQNLNPLLEKTRPFLPQRTLLTFILIPDYTPLLFFHSSLENTTNNQCLMHLGCCPEVCLSLLHIYLYCNSSTARPSILCHWGNAAISCFSLPVNLKPWFTTTWTCSRTTNQ